MADNIYRGDYSRYAGRCSYIDPRDAEIERLQRRVAKLEWGRHHKYDARYASDQTDNQWDGPNPFADAPRGFRRYHHDDPSMTIGMKVEQLFNLEYVPEPFVDEYSLPIYDTDGEEEEEEDTEPIYDTDGEEEKEEPHENGVNLTLAPRDTRQKQEDETAFCRSKLQRLAVNLLSELFFSPSGLQSLVWDPNNFDVLNLSNNSFYGNITNVLRDDDIIEMAIVHVKQSPWISVMDGVDSRTSLFEEGENDAYPYDPGGHSFINNWAS